MRAQDYTRVEECISAFGAARGVHYGQIVPSFDYDDDPRELCVIPEVCAYMRGLFAAHPEILYYCAQDADVIRPLLLTICNAIIVSQRAGRAQIGIPDISTAVADCTTVVTAARDKAVCLGQRAHARKIVATANGILPLNIK